MRKLLMLLLVVAGVLFLPNASGTGENVSAESSNKGVMCGPLKHLAETTCYEVGQADTRCTRAKVLASSECSLRDVDDGNNGQLLTNQLPHSRALLSGPAACTVSVCIAKLRSAENRIQADISTLETKKTGLLREALVVGMSADSETTALPAAAAADSLTTQTDQDAADDSVTKAEEEQSERQQKTMQKTAERESREKASDALKTQEKQAAATLKLADDKKRKAAEVLTKAEASGDETKLHQAKIEAKQAQERIHEAKSKEQAGKAKAELVVKTRKKMLANSGEAHPDGTKLIDEVKCEKCTCGEGDANVSSSLSADGPKAPQEVKVKPWVRPQVKKCGFLFRGSSLPMCSTDYIVPDEQMRYESNRMVPTYESMQCFSKMEQHRGLLERDHLASCVNAGPTFSVLKCGPKDGDAACEKGQAAPRYLTACDIGDIGRKPNKGPNKVPAVECDAEICGPEFDKCKSKRFTLRRSNKHTPFGTAGMAFYRSDANANDAKCIPPRDYQPGKCCKSKGWDNACHGKPLQSLGSCIQTSCACADGFYNDMLKGRVIETHADGKMKSNSMAGIIDNLGRMLGMASNLICPINTELTTVGRNRKNCCLSGDTIPGDSCKGRKKEKRSYGNELAEKWECRLKPRMDTCKTRLGEPSQSTAELGDSFMRRRKKIGISFKRKPNPKAPPGMPMKNIGRNCWSGCGRIDGHCPKFCGSAMCCRKGYKKHGCDGRGGGAIAHMCVDLKASFADSVKGSANSAVAGTVTSGILKMLPTDFREGAKLLMKCKDKKKGLVSGLLQGDRECNRGLHDVLSALLLKLGFNPVGYHCICKTLLQEFYFNPFRVITADATCFRDETNNCRTRMNTDCIKEMKEVSEHEEALATCQRKGGNCLSEKRSADTAQGGMVSCPQRDMPVFKGRHVEKSECVRRCRAAGYNYAGRQGDPNHPGLQNCFCGHAYGRYGQLALRLQDGSGPQLTYGGYNHPNLVHPYHYDQSIFDSNKASPWKNGITYGFLKSGGKGLTDWWGGFRKGQGRPQLVVKGGYATGEEAHKKLQYVKPVQWKSLAEGSCSVPFSNAALPNLANCVYDTATSRFMGVESDPELVRILMTWKKKGSDGNVMEESVCRMAVDIVVPLCTTCCCDRGVVAATINTALIDAAGIPASTGKLDREAYFNDAIEASPDRGCKQWFQHMDLFSRFILNLFRTMTATIAFKQRGCV